MGVTGLLPFVKDASSPATIQQLKSLGVKAAAVDAYCWLHRAAAAVAGPSGLVPGALVKYCMTIINMLLSHDIKPVIVFDGRHLPAKAGTEDKRREARKVAKKKAAEFLQLGRMDEAKKYIRQSIDITHEMALELIKECRKMNVDCIVAPYEADAQLAYLNKVNIVQVVITEDSDLILFGCTKIFFKMDTGGGGMLFERSKLPLVMKGPIEKFNFDKFRQICILSGCDYLPSLPGIGLAKAKQFINATRDPNIGNALKKIPSFFNKSQLQVTEDYCDGFLKAEATFKHQLVYDPIKRILVPLMDIQDEGTDPKYCTNAGDYLEDEIAFQLALGNLDPFTLQKMDNWNPDDPNYKPMGVKTNKWNQNSIAPHKSIWSREYTEHLNYNAEKKSVVNAITIPTTKPLFKKIITPQISNQGLTIEDLSSMYCEEPPNKRKKVEDDIIVDQNSNDENKTIDMTSKTSPILAKNVRNHKRIMEGRSFSKLKQFSKFQRTTLDENNIVQSRFFGSFESVSESKEDNMNLLNESINSTDKSDDLIEEEKESYINLSNNTVDSCNNLSKTALNEFKTSPKKISKNPFKKQESSEDFIATQDSFKVEEILISSSQIDVIGETEEIVDIVRNNLNIDTDKKSNFSSKTVCRRIGLTKRSISSNSLSNQQSLLTKFGFQKKSQLKH